MAKNYRFLAIVNWTWDFVYRIDWKYYIVNSKWNKKEVQKFDFIFIA